MDHYIYRHQRAIWRRAGKDTWRSVASHVKWEALVVLAAALLAAWRDDLTDFVIALQGPGWGLVVLRGLVGGMAVAIVAVTITFLKNLLVAPARINKDQLVTIQKKESVLAEYYDSHPKVEVSFKFPFETDAFISIKNIGATAEFSARLVSFAGSFHGFPVGDVYCQWSQGGTRRAQLVKGAEPLSLHIAQFRLVAAPIDPSVVLRGMDGTPFPVVAGHIPRSNHPISEWTVFYTENDVPQTTVDFQTLEALAIEDRAVLQIEIVSIPELPDGPIRRRVLLQGFNCWMEDA